VGQSAGIKLPTFRKPNVSGNFCDIPKIKYRMTRILKALLVISVLAMVLFSYRIFILPYLLKKELLEIVDSGYFKEHQNATYCFSDRRHDGSEIVINQIDDNKLKEHLKETIKLVRHLVGGESRIWIYVDSNDLQNIVVKINTSREWKQSVFYFGDYKIKFINGEILDDNK
jgi:hypothetical protein